MATRNVLIDTGSGPDIRALGGHMLISRYVPGLSGDTYIHATPEKVVITDPPTSVALEVGIIYRFDPRSPIGVPKTSLIPAGAGDILYGDLVQLADLPIADAPLLIDALVDADVVGDDLIVRHYDGHTTNAGNVRGPAGGTDAATAEHVDTGLLTTAVLDRKYATATDSTQRLMAKLTNEQSDASMLVVGDSTGQETTEWVYRLGQSLATSFPAWTVLYRLWNDATPAYDTAVTLQTGTGARTLTIYNASVSGFTTNSWQALRAQAAIYDLTPDLVMLSMGHNEQVVTADVWHSRYVSLTESLTEGLPGADLILVSQNPATANTNQEARGEVYREIAARRGYGFIDVCRAFLATGDAPGLTEDGVHPNAAGKTLWLDTVKRAFAYQPDRSPRPQAPSSLTVVGEQLATNGDFAAFAGAIPDGWTLSLATASKDLTNYESPNGYAVKLTATGTGGYIQQSFPIKRVLGKWVTITARVYVPVGQSSNVARFGIADSAGSTIHTADNSQGRFRWVTVSRYIAPGVTNPRLLTYVDTSAGLGNFTVDRIIITIGKYPHSAATPNPGPTGAAGTALGQIDHLSTFGPIPALTLNASTFGAITVGGANQGIFSMVVPHRDMSITKLRWLCGIQSGNYDIGLLDAAGTILWSKGSTASPAVGMVTETFTAVNLVAGTKYWVAFSMDNTTMAIRGVAGQSVDFQRLLNGDPTVLLKSSQFPLTTGALGTTGNLKMPIIVLAEA